MLDIESSINQPVFQFKQKYIITQKDGQLLIIHQHRAHQLILYHELLKQLEQEQIPVQQLIFPVEIQLNPNEIALLKPNAGKIKKMGFDMQFSDNNILIQGVPLQLKTMAVTEIFEDIIQQLSYENPGKLEHIEQNLAKIIAQKSAVKTGTKLEVSEMENILSELFKLPEPAYTTDGKKIMMTIKPQDIDRKFDL
jgi:DNA mismatch repair protein MutL